MFTKKIASIKKQEGSLLIEALVSIAIVSVILAIGAQIILASLKSDQVASEKNVALGLAEEAFEAMNNIAMENWQNIYKPPGGAGDAITSKGAANHFYPRKMGGKWELVSGDNQASVDGMEFAVYVNIDNISRDAVTRNIESAYNIANDDPSTQKISVFVTRNGGEQISLTDYILRWRNEVCAQTDWSGGVSGATSTCPTSSYGSSSNVNTSAGSLELSPL